MKKEITEGILSLSTHKNTRIVNDATGIARMTERRGAMTVRKTADPEVRTARAVPSRNAAAKPDATLTIVESTDR